MKAVFKRQLWFCGRCHKWFLVRYEPKYCPYCRSTNLGFATFAKVEID